MDWFAAFKIFQVAMSIFSSLAPEIASQHWNGNGTDGKIANAVQIVKDVGMVSGTLAENLAASGAIQNAHPDIVVAAGATSHPNYPSQDSAIGVAH